MSASVSGRTPWPRLKICPAGSRPLQHPSHLRLDRGYVREQNGRSRLPCSGIRARMCWSTSVSSTRKSTPSTSQPTSAICGAKWLAPTPKWIPGTPTSAMAAKTSAVCGAACCAYRRAGSAPTQNRTVGSHWHRPAPVCAGRLQPVPQDVPGERRTGLDREASWPSSWAGPGRDHPRSGTRRQ